MDRAAAHRDPRLSAALLAPERRRVVAHLARALGLGHLALAEDAVQTATLRALERWPLDGVPDAPAAWLYRVANRAAIDQLRADRRHVPWDGDGAGAAPGSGAGAHPDLAPGDSPGPGSADHGLVSPAPAGRLAGELDDDELALLFAACHPSLPPATQVALALHTLGGHALAVLAPLLFTTEPALAQRLARARAVLADQRLHVPAGHELAPRREAVLTALSLMFHAGQVASGRQGGAPAAHEALLPCWEAIRLARAVAAHPATADAEADALAALLLLHGARLTGRVDAHGDIVPLRGQPRDRWDGGLLRLGFAHLGASQRGDRLTRWHLQAGIAGEHARATDPAHTDWAAIVRYYDLLLECDPSPAPRLGHAIALAEAGSPAEARQRLQALLPTVPNALRAHTWAALARAAERLDDPAQAAACLAQAIAHAPHPADARRLRAGSAPPKP